MGTMRRVLGDALGGADIESLWLEYENGETREAQLLKDLDKLEMLVQAEEYERSQNMPLGAFFESCAHYTWATPIGQAWAAEIESRRQPPVPSPHLEQ